MTKKKTKKKTEKNKDLYVLLLPGVLYHSRQVGTRGWLMGDCLDHFFVVQVCDSRSGTRDDNTIVTDTGWSSTEYLVARRYVFASRREALDKAVSVLADALSHAQNELAEEY